MSSVRVSSSKGPAYTPLVSEIKGVQPLFRLICSELMLGPHAAGLHLGLNLPYVTTPKGLLISKPAMAEPSRIWTPDDIAWSPTSFASGHNERDEVLGPMSGKYCADLRQVVRRKTRTVTAGPVKFGSDHPIVRQTMGAASTVKRSPWALCPSRAWRLGAARRSQVGRSCRATNRPAAAGARASCLQSRRSRRLAARASRLQYLPCDHPIQVQPRPRTSGAQWSR